MTGGAALLVDADNVSAALVQKAVHHLEMHAGAVHIRRAYGGLEKLGGLKDVLRQNGFRAHANHGKGTTDVALTVDCMDLLHLDQLPAVVAIASSDADYAALVLRLREAGKRVICFAHRPASDELALTRNYTQVVFDTALGLAEVTGQVMRAAPAPAPRSAAPTVAAKAPAPVPAPVAVPAPARSVTSAQAPNANPALVPVAANGAASDDIVRKILDKVPGWLPNTVKQLNQLGTPLREAGIKRGSKPLHEVFRKYPEYFRVMPATGQAKQVKLLAKPPKA